MSVLQLTISFDIYRFISNSGAKNPVVPHLSNRIFSSNFEENPKSHKTALKPFVSLNRMFSGFISACTIFLSYKYANPSMIPRKIY